MTAYVHQNEYLAALGSRAGDPMQREVREVMTPGVVVIVEDASLQHAYRAIMAHRVHALLVVGQASGEPVGWVTAHGLLGALDSDSLTPVGRVIDAPALSISPSATAREAVAALSEAGVQRLLVQSTPDALPEGVVTAIDLVALRSG